MPTNKPKYGNLVWMPKDGNNKIVMEKRTWMDLGREKTRLENEFPAYYGNEKLGKLKSRYILLNK